MTGLERFRRLHPIGFSVAAALLAMLFVMGSGLAVGLLRLVLPITDYYVLAFLQEALAAVLVWLLLRQAGCGRVLLQKGCGFLRGLEVGLYPLVLTLLVLAAMLAEQRQAGAPLASPGHIAAFAGTMLLIGLVEEMAFRGLVATTLLEHFGTGRAGVWKATVLSGLLFGAAHMTNLLSAPPLGVFVQAVVASVLGMLFAAIYYRTGNLWVVIALHAGMDFASLSAGGLFAGEYAGQGVEQMLESYTLLNLTPALTYGLPVLFLLRNRKLAEIRRLWTRPETDR